MILSLYVSTFYGRYHYLTDAVAGVLIAFVALALAPRIMRIWDQVVEKGTVGMVFARAKAE